MCLSIHGETKRGVFVIVHPIAASRVALVSTERDRGIEPPSHPWEGCILPVN